VYIVYVCVCTRHLNTSNQCENCEISTGGSSGETPEASRGGTRGRVFPPVNVVIANLMVQKESLIGGQKITG